MFLINLKKVVEESQETIIKHLAYYLQHHQYIHTGEFLKQFSKQELEYLLHLEEKDFLLLAMMLLQGEGVIVERENSIYAAQVLQLLIEASINYPVYYKNFSLDKLYQNLIIKD